mmetsp:Transcript_13325/g.20050  ORF Transcript_13325/g.20050 Transcript_13325/m.20050 type:complete len:91 (+) Transcript_13325:299-571(+)
MPERFNRTSTEQINITFYIKNLPLEFTLPDVADLFSLYGVVREASLGYSLHGNRLVYTREATVIVLMYPSMCEQALNDIHRISNMEVYTT